MTKKKRKRKEQHHQRGNPPPPQVTPLRDASDRPVKEPPSNLLYYDELDELDAMLDDPSALEGVSPFADNPEELGPDYQMRPMERQLMRIQRYRERNDVTVSPENEQDVEELLDTFELRDEATQFPTTPLERAQELIYDAFELPGARWPEQVSLAKQALRISHNCADAHVLLAELESPTNGAAERHYADAVRAAGRALKDVDVASRPRDYWHLMKIRPLLRALGGLANIQNIQGKYEQALDTYRRLYEIDQLDVLYIREGYVGLLMERGLDTEFVRFLEQQGRLDRPGEETAHVLYSHALARFWLEGDSDPAREALDVAQDSQPLIARYLLGAERLSLDPLILPDSDPARVTAIEYVMNDCRLWLRTPNAIEWLRANTPADVLCTSGEHR